MDKHLQALVLAQVLVGVLVDGLRLVLAQVLGHQAESLLVVLDQLGRTGVGGTRDARRQHVGHGLAVGVLLNVHGTYFHETRLGSGGRLQALLVLPPLAAHQVERTEAQHDGAAEAREEHTHEADAGEVVDGAFLLLVLGEGDAILIPAHGHGVAIAQLGIVVAMVHDIGVVALRTVVVGLQLVVADAYAVLVVAVVLVQGEVLVDVLHVGRSLVGGVVALRTLVRGGRVALRVVDAPVAVQDAATLLVVVAATVIVVVVAGGVVVPGLAYAVVGHDAVHGVEPRLVVAILALLRVGQAVVAHVLQGARAGGRGKGVGLRGLHGNAPPLRVGKVLSAVDGHTALVELLAVAQHVLRDLA